MNTAPLLEGKQTCATDHSTNPAILNRDMAAIFDGSNPASPVACAAWQTALILLDYQGFTVDACGESGRSALAKGVAMREWALAKGIKVIHSIVDVNERPPPDCKGVERITKLLEEIAKTEGAAEEPAEIACGESENEYVVMKHPGTVSGLQSVYASSILTANEIENLILCGISTSGAVLRTAVPATDEGYVVTVIEDACCDRDQGLHETLMTKVLPSRAHVTTADEFIRQWAKVQD